MSRSCDTDANVMAAQRVTTSPLTCRACFANQTFDRTQALAPYISKPSILARHADAYPTLAAMATNADNPRLQLRTWALMRRPETLPPTVRHSVTDTTIAILDKYPKSIFHALVLPRPRDGLTKENLDSLHALLTRQSVGKERVKEVLEDMGKHARMVRDEIKQDMLSRFKFQWDVWIGFHAVPSMK